MKKLATTWKFCFVLGVIALWFWQSNKALEETQTILIRGHLGTIATNVLRTRGQEFEVRGDFVYLDTSRKQETLENLSAALTSVRHAGGNDYSELYRWAHNRAERFPVFGPQWEPVGYYKTNNIYYVDEPDHPHKIMSGPHEGMVEKRHLDDTEEAALLAQRCHDYQALRAAMEKLDDRVVLVAMDLVLEVPCLGEVPWDTPRPIQKL